MSASEEFRKELADILEHIYQGLNPIAAEELIEALILTHVIRENDFYKETDTITKDLIRLANNKLRDSMRLIVKGEQK